MVGRLAIGIVLVIVFYMVGTSQEAREFANIQEASVVSVEKMSVDPSPELPLATEPLTALVDSPEIPDSLPTEVEPAKVTDSLPLEIKSNEQVIAERLLAAGFTREQTAGIWGNLKQEFNFNTGDVPGGLGIAQWMGNRRANLMARDNYLDVTVQVDFMLDELRGVESYAMRKIQAATTVEAATIAFQNAYERCGNCKQQQRIQYAYEWYNR